jgi:hypothetical protein
MDALPDVAGALARWLDGPVLPLLTLVLGYLGARLVGLRQRLAAGKRGGSRDGDAGFGDTDGLGRATATAPQDTAGAPATGQTERYEMQVLLGRLEQENRYLEQALAHRGADIQLLTARMNEAAARDREELVHLQDELEAERRIGHEKARLIRVLEASLQRADSRLQNAQAGHERQRVSMVALQAALAHAKRALASTDGRLARLREQLRMQAATASPGSDHATGEGAGAGTPVERIVERIVEIPVETIVYRDREVPVEVPIEVPVGFTVLPTPGASGLRPRYSENRPSST